MWCRGFNVHTTFVYMQCRWDLERGNMVIASTSACQVHNIPGTYIQCIAACLSLILLFEKKAPSDAIPYIFYFITYAFPSIHHTYYTHYHRPSR